MATSLQTFQARLAVHLEQRLTIPFTFRELLDLAPRHGNRDVLRLHLESLLARDIPVNAYYELVQFGASVDPDTFSEVLRAEEIPVTDIDGFPHISPWDLRQLLANFGNESVRKHANYLGSIWTTYQEMRADALMAEIKRLQQEIAIAPASDRDHLEKRLSQLSQAYHADASMRSASQRSRLQERYQAYEAPFDTSMRPLTPFSPDDPEETESDPELEEDQIETLQVLVQQMQSAVRAAEESLDQAEERLNRASARLVRAEMEHALAKEAVEQSVVNVGYLRADVREVKDLLRSMETQAPRGLSMTLDELGIPGVPTTPLKREVQTTPRPERRVPTTSPARGSLVQTPPRVPRSPLGSMASSTSTVATSCNPIRDAALRCTFPDDCAEPKYLAATFEIETNDTILIRVFPNKGQSLEIMMKKMREQMAKGCAIAIPPARFVALDTRDDIRDDVVKEGTEHFRAALGESGRSSVIHFQLTMIRVKKTSDNVAKLVRKALDIYASQLEKRSFEILESQTAELQALKKPISINGLGKIIASMQFE